MRLALGLSNRHAAVQAVRSAGSSRCLVGRDAPDPLDADGGRGGPDGAGAERHEAERELAAAIRSDLVPATVAHGPLVSIVILNRDGRGAPRALSRGPCPHDIPWTSRSSSSTTARPMVQPSWRKGLSLPFPLRVIRNEENRSFSDANDQAVGGRRRRTPVFPQQRRRTDHRRLARLHGRDPDDDGCGRGRCPADLSRAVAAESGPVHDHADLTLQHRGVAFDRTEAVPLPARDGRRRGPTRRPARSRSRTGRR